MRDMRFALPVACLLALVSACSGATPTASPRVTNQPTTAPTVMGTPAPTTAPTANPTDAPTEVPTTAPTAAPTGTPLPSPTAADIAAWATEVCDLNTDFLTDSQKVTTDFPDPAVRDFESVRSVYAQRQPGVEQAYQDALDRVKAVTPYPGGESFRLALLNDFQSSLDAMPAFFAQVADATTVEGIDAAEATRGTVGTAGLLAGARAVSAIDIAFADAIAPIDTGCRFFELDARARVHNVDVPAFTKVAFEDTFDDDSKFSTGPFGGGTREIADGALTITFSDGSSFINVAKPAKYHDARFETTLHINGFALGGLACRDNGNKRYSVLVNPIGLILIYGSGAVLARRAAPEGFDATNDINLAIACVAGNLDPFTVAVYFDGELVAEVQQEHALASEGLAGMYAQSFGAGSSVSFDSFRVLVEPD